MKIESAKLRYRPVTMDDQASLKVALSDWPHDNTYKGRSARFTDQRIYNTLDKWVSDMEVEPYEAPLTSSSSYRQALAAYLDSTSSVSSPPGSETVVGVVVFGAKGKEIIFESGAIHPSYRRGGLYTELYTTMGHYCFRTLQADSLVWKIPQSVSPPQTIQSKFSDYITKTGEEAGKTETNNAYTITKAQFASREADSSGAAEKALKYEFTA